MRLPANISYLIKSKQNEKLPDVFNEFILDSLFQMSSFVEVFEYRLNMLADNTLINITDFGTGKNRRRKVKNIAKTSSTELAYGGIMQKLVDTYGLKSALEFGTSVGIGTMFLAKSSSKMNVTTIEACKETYNFTKNEFEKRKIKNVNFINDNFDYILDNNLLKDRKFELFYLDGNHTYSATLKYFDYFLKTLSDRKSIIIIDDINWSREMFKAWREISAKMTDSLRLNLYRMGIIFTGYNLPKEEISAEIFKEK